VKAGEGRNQIPFCVDEIRHHHFAVDYFLNFGSTSVCEGLLEVDLHTSVSYCVVIRSCAVILHCVGISSCVGSAPARCILQNRKTNAWSKNASKNSKREGWASSVKTFVTGRGVMYAGQVVKIECLKVKFEFSKVRFALLKGQRSVQHPEDIRVNECTPILPKEFILSSCLH